MGGSREDTHADPVGSDATRSCSLRGDPAANHCPSPATVHQHRRWERSERLPQPASRRDRAGVQAQRALAVASGAGGFSEGQMRFSGYKERKGDAT